MRYTDPMECTQRHYHDFVCPPRAQRAGVTLVEVLVVIAVAGTLVSLLLPAVMSARESSRRVQCANHLRQLGLAAHAYVDAHGAFPYTSVSSGEFVNGVRIVHRAVSPHQGLIGYIDPAISNALDRRDASLPFVNDRPPSNVNLTNRKLLKTPVPVFLCPSDLSPPGGTNYRGNMGISINLWPYEPRPSREKESRMGAFVNAQAVRPDEFTDGLSTTALFSERVVGDGDPSRYTPWRDIFSPPPAVNTTDQAIRFCREYATANPPGEYSYAGYTWIYGCWAHTWYNHILTPLSPTPDCASGGGGFSIGGGGGLYTARSLHPGGVNLATADGAVRFVSETIDLQAWRALGTRNGGEVDGTGR